MSSTKRPIQELFPLMYSELRRVAGRYLGRERANHTLQPTALVNEAWLRLQNERGAALPGRTQGLALAAQAMRRVLVDEAIDPRGAEIVALRFFSGLSVPEVADHLGVSVSTVEGKWTHARAWLRRDLSRTPPEAAE